MLETRKSISLNGQSSIDNEILANFNASIDGSVMINCNIYRREEAGKEQIRKDFLDFVEHVYAVIDEQNQVSENEAK